MGRITATLLGLLAPVVPARAVLQINLGARTTIYGGGGSVAAAQMVIADSSTPDKVEPPVADHASDPSGPRHPAQQDRPQPLDGKILPHRHHSLHLEDQSDTHARVRGIRGTDELPDLRIRR